MKRDGCPLSEAAKWWYNVTAMKLHITGVHYTPIQLKMPLEIERIIEVNDPVYTFHEVMSRVVTGHYGGYVNFVVAADHSGHKTPPKGRAGTTGEALRAMACVVTGHYGGLRACP